MYHVETLFFCRTSCCCCFQGADFGKNGGNFAPNGAGLFEKGPKGVPKNLVSGTLKIGVPDCLCNFGTFDTYVSCVGPFRVGTFDMYVSCV